MDKNINPILDRLKTVLNFFTDKQLAEFLGVPQSSIGNWRHKNTMNWFLLFEKCKDLDLNLILLGKRFYEDTEEYQEWKKEKAQLEGKVMVLRDIISEYRIDR